MRCHCICDCAGKGISGCSCDRYFSQPDCDVGWDSSRDCWYHGYDLYMLAASDSESDLPVFPLLNPASKHDSHSFSEAFFRMKSFLPGFHATKLLLDSAHDAMPVYECYRRERIVPFINLNEKRGIKVKYKHDFTIGKDGVPVQKPLRNVLNKREKLDFKLEDGRHRSAKMWYCRLYHTMMLQHLDAWDLPFESTLRKLILQTA